MKLKGKRIAYLVEAGFEDLEFWVPVMRLREEGATVVIIGTRMTLSGSQTRHYRRPGKIGRLRWYHHSWRLGTRQTAPLPGCA